MNFAQSKDLLDSPFIDINASIWAAIAQCYTQGARIQKQKWVQKHKGDFYDAPMLATVLPYCDVATTDSFMKRILVDSRLRFDKKYKCEIFSASKTDRQAFQKLIKGLK